MTFEMEDIDQAVVATQYRLLKCSDPVELERITRDFMDSIFGHKRNPSDESYAGGHFKRSFEQTQIVCKRLMNDCGDSQREAVKLVTERILERYKEMREEVLSNKRPIKPYLKAWNRASCWGAAVHALAEAFVVEIPCEDVVRIEGLEDSLESRFILR